MNKISFLSILIPVFNEEACINSLYNRLNEVLVQLAFESEIIFINDGSTDNSLGIIKNLQALDKRINYIDLSRNFGKEVAMKAGIDHLNGDAMVIIDADLQDPPELIIEMVKEIENGFDDVYAHRISRQGETIVKKTTSTLYYKILKKISNIPIQENTGDYRMFSKKAILALQELKESELNMKGLFSYVGFNKKPIYYDRDQRVAGETKWNYIKLINLAIKGLTSFSIAPLRIVSIAGMLVSFFAFAFLIFIIFKTLFLGESVVGYPSLMVIILFIGGIQLLAIGLIGEYIGVIYSETKKRPTYFINEYKKG